MKDEFWAERGIAYRINEFEISRETLVFVHGLGSTCSGWEPFEAALQGEFNVLTYDMRGHGLSRRYRSCSDYSFEKLADDLAALLEFLDIRSCTIVSNSLGTIVALLLQKKCPGVVRGNVLLAPVYKRATGEPAKSSNSGFIGLLSLLPLLRTRGRRVDLSKFTTTDDLDLRRMLPEIMSMSVRAYAFYLHHLNSFADYGLWSQINVPSTIIHGTKDSFSSFSSAVELAGIMPQATLVALEGANHIVIVNNKEEVISHIKTFAPDRGR